MTGKLPASNFQTQLRMHTGAFLQEQPALRLWAEELFQVILHKLGDRAELALPFYLSARDVQRFALRMAGDPPHPPRLQKSLDTLDNLAALWHAANLVFVPSLAPRLRLTRKHCVEFKPANEVAAHSFRLLARYFLYRESTRRDSLGIEPAWGKYGLDEEDHRSCAALFAMLICGDLLTRNLSAAVAGFSINGLDTREPWTMVAWYKRQQRRWPLSWLSILYLLRLLSWQRRQDPKAFLFFGSRYFTWEKDQSVPRSKNRHCHGRTPRLDKYQRVVLHETFNRWLGWLTESARKDQNEGQAIPLQLKFSSAITAARILAATRCPPAVVTYLSGLLPSPPMDEPSWNAFLHGTRTRVFAEEKPGQAGGRKTSSLSAQTLIVSPPSIAQAEEALRSLRLLLLSLEQNSSPLSRKGVEARIISLAETLPALEAKDGDSAYLGHLKGALLYMAHRLRTSAAQPRSLLGEMAKASDVALNLLGTRSIFSLTGEELTGLAVDYIQGYETYHSQRTAKEFLKRFMSFLLGHRQEHATGENSLPLVSWKHPDLRLEHTLDARGIVTPRQFAELLAGVQDERDKLAFTILGCLGIYCGLRESEAVNLTANDVQVTTELEVVIRRSKTPSGRRRLPVSVLVPAPWRDTVVSHLRSLWQARDSAPQTPIIPEPDMAMARMERSLKRNLGASSHMLRHSAVSLLVIRLYMAYNLIMGEPACLGTEELRSRLERLHGELFSRESLLDLAQGLLGPGWRTSQPMIIPVASKLLGHAEPGVTVSVYLHALDFLAAATRALLPQPNLSLNQAMTLREVSERTILRLRKTGGAGYPVRLIALDWARKLKVIRGNSG